MDDSQHNPNQKSSARLRNRLVVVMVAACVALSVYFASRSPSLLPLDSGRLAHVMPEPAPPPVGESLTVIGSPAPSSAPTQRFLEPTGGTDAVVWLVGQGKSALASIAIQVSARTGTTWSDPKTFVSDVGGAILLPGLAGTEARLEAPIGMSFQYVPGLSDYSHVRNDVVLPLTVSNTLSLQECRRLRINVRYADGAPYLGEISVKPGNDRSWNILLTERPLPDLVWCPDKWTTAVVSALSRRPGFGDVTSLVLSPEAHLDATGEGYVELSASLPTDESNRGCIEIDLSAHDAKTSFSYVADLQRSGKPPASKHPTQTSATGLAGGSAYVTRTLDPGSYQLVVISGGMDVRYRSQNDFHQIQRFEAQVEVVGRTTQVVVIPTTITSGSVELTVLDSEGSPLSGAVVTTGDSGPISWYGLSRCRPGHSRVGIKPLSMSDAQGRTVVHGLACSPQTLTVHAQGYQHASLQVFPIPGRVSPYGEVRLAPATGAIAVAVELLQANDDDHMVAPTMTLLLLRTGGSVVLPKHKMTELMHRFDGLPFGRYSVALVVDQGWVVTRAVNLDLTADSPHQSVTFTVSRR